MRVLFEKGLLFQAYFRELSLSLLPCRKCSLIKIDRRFYTYFQIIHFKCLYEVLGLGVWGLGFGVTGVQTVCSSDLLKRFSSLQILIIMNLNLNISLTEKENVRINKLPFCTKIDVKRRLKMKRDSSLCFTNQRQDAGFSWKPAKLRESNSISKLIGNLQNIRLFDVIGSETGERSRFTGKIIGKRDSKTPLGATGKTVSLPYIYKLKRRRN